MAIFQGYCLDEKVHPSNPLQNIFPHFTHIVDRSSTPQWTLAPACHPPHNLILIYDGVATYGSGDSDVEYRAVPGDLIYFKAGEFRWGKTSPDHLMKCYAVDFFYTCPIWRDGHWEMAEPPLPLDTFQRIDDSYVYHQLLTLFRELTNIWTVGRPNRIMECRSLFIEIISLLLLWKSGNGANFIQVQKVDQVIRHMMEHYAENLTLRDLSALVRISPSYLGSIFKKVTGRSPIDYLIEIRLGKAKEMLRDGHPVLEVAAKTGFNDAFYFSKCFKEREGIPPSHFAAGSQPERVERSSG